MVTDEQLRRRKYDRLHFGNFNEQKIENKQDKNGKRKKNEKLSHTIIFTRKNSKIQRFQSKALEWHGQNWTKLDKMFKFQNGPKSQWMKNP